MWSVLASIADKLLSLFADWLKKREQEVAQHERDLLEESPGDWFNSHFDGMSDSKSKEPPTN